MKKLNNRGFAASVVLYGASTIIILIMILILSILSTGENNVSRMVDTIKKEASGVTGTTYQLRNLVSNGSFERGASSWRRDMITTVDGLENEISSDDYKSGSQSLYIYPRGWQYQRLNGAISPGDKIYIGASVNLKLVAEGTLNAGLSTNGSKAEGKTNGIKLEEVEGSYSTSTVTDGFVKHGAIGLVKDDSEVFAQVGVSGSSTIEGYVDNIVAVNLTQVFGAGNEPSLAWCNENIDYFEGTLSITVYEDE